MKKLYIQITNQIVEDARDACSNGFTNEDCCPIALALKDKFNSRNVSVLKTGSHNGTFANVDGKIYRFSPNLMKVIDDFDSKRKVATGRYAFYKK